MSTRSVPLTNQLKQVADKGMNENWECAISGKKTYLSIGSFSLRYYWLHKKCCIINKQKALLSVNNHQDKGEK